MGTVVAARVPACLAGGVRLDFSPSSGDRTLCSTQAMQPYAAPLIGRGNVANKAGQRAIPAQKQAGQSLATGSLAHSSGVLF